MNHKQRNLLVSNYYVSEIQLAGEVVGDILCELSGNMKMLVFGLGHDSPLWFHATKGNICFVEHDRTYIELNRMVVPMATIIHHTYEGITVSNGRCLKDSEIESFVPPAELLKEAPFDLILIDGPPGWKPHHPGRLLPIHWSSRHLAQSGSIFYIDDCTRDLESWAITKYFRQDEFVKIFPQREGTVKIRKQDRKLHQ